MDGITHGEGTSLKTGGLVLPLRDLGPQKTLQFSMSNMSLLAVCSLGASLFRQVCIYNFTHKNTVQHGVTVPMELQPVETHKHSQTALLGDQQFFDPSSHLPAGTCHGCHPLVGDLPCHGQRGGMGRCLEVSRSPLAATVWCQARWETLAIGD